MNYVIYGWPEKLQLETDYHYLHNIGGNGDRDLFYKKHDTILKTLSSNRNRE